MKNKAYFLCSSDVIDSFPDCEKSNPFRSGYAFDKGVKHYVAVLDFKKVKKRYSEIMKDESTRENNDFWCRECVPGQMDVSKITITGAKRQGLFVEIEDKIGLTKETNIAMTIWNLSEKYRCTPIELINKIVKPK